MANIEEVVAVARRRSRDIAKNVAAEIHQKIGPMAAAGRYNDSRATMFTAEAIDSNYQEAGIAMANVLRQAFKDQANHHADRLSAELEELKSSYSQWTHVPDNNAFGDLAHKLDAANKLKGKLEDTKSEIIAAYRNNILSIDPENAMKVDLNANAGSVIVANLNSPGAHQTVHAAVQTSINMAQVRELADQAIRELDGIEIDHDLKNDLQDDLKSIAHEASGEAPDESRLKRLMKKIGEKVQDGADNIYVKGTEATGSAIGAAAISALSKVIFGS